MLRELERSRGLGLTVDELAHLSGVTTRTVRRDLQALEGAGFPIFDDKSHDDGRTRWTANGQASKGLAAGLSLSAPPALAFSRTLAQSPSCAPFPPDLRPAAAHPFAAAAAALATFR